MEASTFKLKTPHITGGRSHIPLAATEHMSVGLNYYTPGRKNKLHTHPGEDHTYGRPSDLLQQRASAHRA
jgi:hypothetical protein